MGAGRDRGNQIRPESHRAIGRRKIKLALDLMAKTRARLAKLPDIERDALVKTISEGRSYEDVARELGLTLSALEETLTRARKTLRQMIQQEMN